MQAILLTELFQRFRSRKTVVKTSRQFEELYNRVSPHVNLSIPHTISISSFKSREQSSRVGKSFYPYVMSTMIEVQTDNGH